jgi:hypothetical protein
MLKEFDIHKWNLNTYKLIKKFPQLTNADLVWRHETKNDLFRSIADKLGITKKDFEEIVENY